MIDYELTSVAGVGKENEDFIVVENISDEIFVAVLSDGMGGLDCANNAAKIVAESIAGYMKGDYLVDDARTTIINSLIQANEMIAIEEQRIHVKMGASVAVVVIVNDKVFVSWLGDVRVYLHRDGIIDLLTEDHISTYTGHSYLNRCINGRVFREDPPLKVVKLFSKDCVVMASDGCYIENDIAGLNLESLNVGYDDASVVKIYVS